MNIPSAHMHQRPQSRENAERVKLDRLDYIVAIRIHETEDC